MFGLFHLENVWVWIPKVQKKALDEDPCSLIQILGNVHRWDRRWPVCGLTGHRCHPRPTLSLVYKVPSSALSQNSSIECRGAGYDLCVHRQSVDATVVPHLDKLDESLAFTISNRYNRVSGRRGVVCLLTDSTSIEVSSVRVEFHCQILNDFV